MATRTISASGGTRNWNDTATWDEGAVPTSADDVVARGDGTSGNVIVNVAAACRSLDETNYVGTVSGSGNLSIGTSSLPASGVAIKLVAGSGWTHTGQLVFVSTTTGGTLTFGGKTMGGVVTFNGSGGGWVLQDTARWTAGTTTVTRGALDLNGQTVTMSSFVASGSNVRSVTFGAATVTMTGTTWDFSGSNITVSAASATIHFSRTSTSTTVTPAAGQTWGTFIVDNAAGLTIATTATTITTLTVTPTAAITLTFPAGVTTTISNAPTLLGIPGKLLTIVSSSGGSAATVSVASGTIRANHASIKDSTVTGGATFQAYDSINVSGNTGWTFVAAKRMSLAGVG